MVPLEVAEGLQAATPRPTRREELNGAGMARGGRGDSAYVSWVKDKRQEELRRGSGPAPDHTWTATRTS
eukprot:COSAG02_NODE_1664_length_11434_cov_51.455404_6_plen_69_part_00